MVYFEQDRCVSRLWRRAGLARGGNSGGVTPERSTTCVAPTALGGAALVGGRCVRMGGVRVLLGTTLLARSVLHGCARN